MSYGISPTTIFAPARTNRTDVASRCGFGSFEQSSRTVSDNRAVKGDIRG